MITITWKVVDTHYVKDTGVIFAASVDLMASEDGIKTKNYFRTELGAPGEAMTPYSDVTEEQVIQWVKQALGEANVALREQAIITSLNYAKNPPPVVARGLPWALIKV